MIYSRRINYSFTDTYDWLGSGGWYSSLSSAEKYVLSKGGRSSVGYDRIVYWPDYRLVGPAVQIAEHIKKTGATHVIVGIIHYMTNGKIGNRGSLPITPQLIYDNSFDPLDTQSNIVLRQFISQGCELKAAVNDEYQTMVDELEKELPLKSRRKQQILDYIISLQQKYQTQLKKYGSYLKTDETNIEMQAKNAEIAKLENCIADLCTKRAVAVKKIRQLEQHIKQQADNQSSVTPDNERCVYIHTRGRNPGARCESRAEPGKTFCKTCKDKKAALTQQQQTDNYYKDKQYIPISVEKSPIKQQIDNLIPHLLKNLKRKIVGTIM